MQGVPEDFFNNEQVFMKNDENMDERRDDDDEDTGYNPHYDQWLWIEYIYTLLIMMSDCRGLTHSYVHLMNDEKWIWSSLTLNEIDGMKE